MASPTEPLRRIFVCDKEEEGHLLGLAPKATASLGPPPQQQMGMPTPTAPMPTTTLTAAAASGPNTSPCRPAAQSMEWFPQRAQQDGLPQGPSLPLGPYGEMSAAEWEETHGDGVDQYDSDAPKPWHHLPNCSCIKCNEHGRQANLRDASNPAVPLASGHANGLGLATRGLVATRAAVRLSKPAIREAPTLAPYKYPPPYPYLQQLQMQLSTAAANAGAAAVSIKPPPPLPPLPIPPTHSATAGLYPLSERAPSLCPFKNPPASLQTFVAKAVGSAAPEVRGGNSE